MPGEGEPIPEYLFEIRDLISNKLCNSNEKFEFLRTYVKVLKDSNKYDISTNRKSLNL